ncbi:hypothetical protein SteCoe_28158 [Stentor coeruleus]|uniref:Lebercilin domain-containing protein n=1 Tax=Stentor coeruleus TaxID=5963 RepID=A0A1R2B8U7_9CILI|nr:hypothetical protein SteCoe_28158 [Stentor coeruleus]
MSTSFENFDKYELNQTPSPGIDYNSLLNNSSINNFDTADLDKCEKYSPIDSHKTESYDIQQLKSENAYLKAQLKIIKKEKEMHVKSNAQERITISKNLQSLKESLHNEVLKLKKENIVLIEKNKDLMKKLQKIQSGKGQKVEFYKKQLENQEKHYQILINDKDRIINSLKKAVGEKKTSKPSSVKKSKTCSRKISVVPSGLVSPKILDYGFYKTSRNKLDEITQVIVKLEKEQAELRESACGVDRLSDSSLDFKSLREPTSRSREKIVEFDKQKIHMRNRMST